MISEPSLILEFVQRKVRQAVDPVENLLFVIVGWKRKRSSSKKRRINRVLDQNHLDVIFLI